MASRPFTLYRKGAAEVLKTVAAEQINSLGRKVRDEVQASVGPDVEVEFEEYTTDRAAAAVVIADSRGVELQATTGALTRAAAAVGLEVRAR